MAVKIINKKNTYNNSHFDYLNNEVNILKMLDNPKIEFELICNDILNNEKFKKLSCELHHGITRYDHSIRVAKKSYKLAKLFRLKNYEILTKASLLHDFYLYDWHNYDDGSHKLHGFSHPKRASHNAKKYFGVSKEIEHVITSHMWPLTFRNFPKSREAWIVCIADKCVAIRETLFAR